MLLKTIIKQEYNPHVLKVCLCSMSHNAQTHGAPASNETLFFPESCDLPPGQSIKTVAAATVWASPHDDSLSNVSASYQDISDPPSSRCLTVTITERKHQLSWMLLIIIWKLVLPSWQYHIWNLSVMLLLVWAHGAHDNCHTLIMSIM